MEFIAASAFSYTARQLTGEGGDASIIAITRAAVGQFYLLMP